MTWNYFNRKLHGKAFTLVQPSPAVMNVLKLARLDSVFEIDQES